MCKIRHFAFLGLLAVGSWSCTSQEADEYAAEFPLNSGRAPGGGGGGGVVGVAYAPGPYGIGLGSTIADLPFLGYGDPQLMMDEYGTSPWDDYATQIRLSDFYNPTGEEVYPEGSPMGEGNDKPLVVLVVTSATWCGPCRFEAAGILPEKHGEYYPDGEFLLALQEGPTPGVPATLADVQNWAMTFDLDYPAVADPPSRVFQYTGVGAYPGMLMIRTKDMKIVRTRIGMVDCAVIGDPVSRADCFEVWDTFEDVMAGNDIQGVD